MTLSKISLYACILKNTFFYRIPLAGASGFTFSLSSFSIQLKLPRGQKIPPDFRNEHAQSSHSKNHTEKEERKKKFRIFNFLDGFSRKKIINQSNLSKTYNHSEK